MKLTIDTKEDSHDEIRKAIRMLSTIVGDEHVYTNSPHKQRTANIFESGSNTVTPAPSSSEASGSVFGNIFGDSSPAATENSEEKKDKEKEEKPQIIVEY
jgi:hypothetical protein